MQHARTRACHAARAATTSATPSTPTRTAPLKFQAYRASWKRSAASSSPSSRPGWRHSSAPARTPLRYPVVERSRPGADHARRLSLHRGDQPAYYFAFTPGWIANRLGQPERRHGGTCLVQGRRNDLAVVPLSRRWTAAECRGAATVAGQSVSPPSVTVYHGDTKVASQPTVAAAQAEHPGAARSPWHAVLPVATATPSASTPAQVTYPRPAEAEGGGPSLGVARGRAIVIAGGGMEA